MSDNKFSISMDKSGVERSGGIVSSIVGLKGLYITNSVQFRAPREKVVLPPPLSSLVLFTRTARGRVM